MAQVIEIVLMLVFGAGALVSAATSIIGLSINGTLLTMPHHQSKTPVAHAGASDICSSRV